MFSHLGKDDVGTAKHVFVPSEIELPEFAMNVGNETDYPKDHPFA
jgi:hypothetical protein